MFWKFHAAPSASVDELLDKQNVTLEQLLDEDDVIQECKAQNSKVVDFLTRPDILASLVSHLVTEPPAGADLTSQYRHASLACEVVTCAIPAVLERLAAERSLLDKLYSLLEKPPPLNPLLASFLSRALALLLVQRPNQLLDYLRSKETFVDLMLQHLGTSAIMDLACNLISGIEDQETRHTSLTWLSGQRLAARLAQLVGDPEQPERQANAALVLVSTVSCARQMALQLPPGETDPNPLLATIETPEFVASLLDGVLGDCRSEPGLVNAVHVLLSLLDTSCGRPAPAPDQEDGAPPPPQEPASVAAAVGALLPRLAALHAVLLAPPARPDIATTWGRLSPPLGATRLQLARLVTALLAARRPAVDAELARLATVDVLMDLFFHYTLNNFLHSQVEQCISLILESPPHEDEEGKSSHPLLDHIFTHTKLIERILHGMEDRETPMEKCGETRCRRSLRAYGGHLVSMANKVCAAAEQGPNAERVRRLVEQLPEAVRAAWSAFTDTQLCKINELNRRAVTPDARQDSSGDSDFRGLADVQQAAIHRLLSEGTAGAMTETFGRADDGFRELGCGAGLLALGAESELRPSAAELFEQRCAERLGGGGGGGADSPPDWAARPAAGSSSDEDEDEDEDGRVRMEVDTSDPWAAAPAAGGATHAAGEANVWQAAQAADMGADGFWANFGDWEATARPASPPVLPSPAQLGVSSDSQTSPGLAPARPPGSESPHYPVDFSNVPAFASSPEPAPMSSSPPREEGCSDPAAMVTDPAPAPAAAAAEVAAPAAPPQEQHSAMSPVEPAQTVPEQNSEDSSGKVTDSTLGTSSAAAGAPPADGGAAD